ncbi:MarR family transcriptional regulator [Burkholderia sp. Ac-20353]|uniref:MarR family winged helix-turn-helix transcriptional regulator n=1 Tax=Burkholderia sp. Ac-20353 TaxID=2703894 RepID=UPI00197C1F35|nr:MarR family transcriptional regulator [Burkholderia sp. Ac-20353]MBN3785535.1 MarR family transcriptional regulator [Burkholderia sp. Ac-20353]
MSTAAEKRASKDQVAAAPSDSNRRPFLSSSSHIELITRQWRYERNDLDLSNFLLAICSMRLGTLVERSFDRMCQHLWNISGSDMCVLLALRRGGPPYAMRPTDLYRALIVTSGAVTKKIDRLANHGMVERMVDPGHAGGFIVHLTKKALDTVERAVVQLAEESSIAPAMSYFSEIELSAGSDFCLGTLAVMEELALPAREVENEENTPTTQLQSEGRARRDR